jgi:hypothetical protein
MYDEIITLLHRLDERDADSTDDAAHLDFDPTIAEQADYSDRYR